MMTPIISSGLVPSGVDIEGEREGRHTELPWSWSGDPCDLVIWSAILDHRICFMTSNGPNAANAAFIVKSVNAHDDLVAALKFTRQFLRAEDVEYIDATLAKAGAS